MVTKSFLKSYEDWAFQAFFLTRMNDLFANVKNLGLTYCDELITLTVTDQNMITIREGSNYPYSL